MYKNIILVVAVVAVIFSWVRYSDLSKTLEESKQELAAVNKSLVIERQVPEVNESAKEFIKALNRSEHKSMLTGTALEEYENYNEEEEDHEDVEEELDLGLQDVEILLANTSTDGQSKTSSTVLYQVIYEGIFDNPDMGVVDRRIISIVMDIDWETSTEKPLVENYKITVLNDSMSDQLFELTEGSE